MHALKTYLPIQFGFTKFFIFPHCSSYIRERRTEKPHVYPKNAYHEFLQKSINLINFEIE